MKCTYRLSLNELLTRPASEMRLVGADGEAGSDTSNSGDTGGDNGKDESGKDKSDETGSDKDKGTGSATQDPKDKRIAQLEEERDRHYNLRKKAEDDLAAANQRIAKLEKDGTTDDETKTKLSGLETEVSNLRVRNTDLALENAFLKDNSKKWKDNDAALKLADLSKVEIDPNTGSVHGLASALERLAANSPWLLEVESAPADKDKKPPVKTGDAPASKDKQDNASQQANTAKLRSKYPGLRR